MAVTPSESGEGEEHEGPFRITDWHGDVVAEELGNVPPLLNQEQIDLLAAHLSTTTITDVSVWEAFKALPDSEDGRGNPGDHYPSCQKCEGEIREGDEYTTKFGYFYCRPCLEGIAAEMEDE